MMGTLINWNRNHFNPFWRILFLDYGIDCDTDLPADRMIFWRKRDKTVCHIERRVFAEVLDEIIYRSGDNPIMTFGGQRPDVITLDSGEVIIKYHEDSLIPSFNALRSEPTLKFTKWIEEYLIPKLK